MEEAYYSPDLQERLDQVMPTIVAMPQEESQVLLDQIDAVAPLCDEANDLTAHCLSGESIRFDLDIISTPPPSIVVRALQLSDGESDRCLHTWTCTEMEERVLRMRDFYHTFSSTGRRPVEPKTIHDPWYVASHREVEAALTESRTQVSRDFRTDRVKDKLKDLVQQSRSKRDSVAREDEMCRLMRHNEKLKSDLNLLQNQITDEDYTSLQFKSDVESDQVSDQEVLRLRSEVTRLKVQLRGGGPAREDMTASALPLDENSNEVLQDYLQLKAENAKLKKALEGEGDQLAEESYTVAMLQRKLDEMTAVYEALKEQKTGKDVGALAYHDLAWQSWIRKRS